MKASSGMEERDVRAIHLSVLGFHTSTQESTLKYFVCYSEMTFRSFTENWYLTFFVLKCMQC